MHKHRGAAFSFHQRADRRAVGPDDQIALPVSGHRAIGGLSGTLADDDVGADVPLRLVLCPSPRNPQRTPSSQAGGQLSFERPTPLNEQRLVDRLMADSHGLIIGEVNRQAVGDLFGTPRRRPASVLPMRLVPPFPCTGLRAFDGSAIRSADAAVEPILHILP